MPDDAAATDVAGLPGRERAWRRVAARAVHIRGVAAGTSLLPEFNRSSRLTPLLAADGRAAACAGTGTPCDGAFPEAAPVAGGATALTLVDEPAIALCSARPARAEPDVGAGVVAPLADALPGGAVLVFGVTTGAELRRLSAAVAARCVTGFAFPALEVDAPALLRAEFELSAEFVSLGPLCGGRPGACCRAAEPLVETSACATPGAAATPAPKVKETAPAPSHEYGATRPRVARRCLPPRFVFLGCGCPTPATRGY